MTSSGRVWPWVGLSLAVSCALPELTIGEGDDSGEGGEGAEGGSSSSGTGGTISGGSSGDSSGGSGKGGTGKGGTSGGGTSGTDTGGSGAEGGSAGSTGGTDSGGTDSGGTDGTGGQGGSNGGSGGQGGTSTGGSGGQGGGGTGGAGTGGAGKGGTGGAGSGGAGTGGAGKGGTGGAGTGGGGCPSVSQLFPAMAPLGSLDGRLITVPCIDSPTTDDCTPSGMVYNGATTPCSGGSLTSQQDFVVGGTPGAMYTVQMHFYGILGPKNYGTAITRESGSTRPTNSNSGATPAPFAYTTAAGAGMIMASTYDTHEIHVLDNNMQVFRQFFLNSDMMEGRWTYVINYARTIPVIGGGRIRMRDYDMNCRVVKNCFNGSEGTGPDCASRARTVDISAASPQPSGLVQPGLGNDDGNAGNWLLVHVVSVSCP